MQRKHFELIARVLKDAEYAVDHYAAVVIAKRFADELAKENARFDRQRFLKACGVNQ